MVRAPLALMLAVVLLTGVAAAPRVVSRICGGART